MELWKSRNEIVFSRSDKITTTSAFSFLSREHIWTTDRKLLLLSFMGWLIGPWEIFLCISMSSDSFIHFLCSRFHFLLFKMLLMQYLKIGLIFMSILILITVEMDLQWVLWALKIKCQNKTVKGNIGGGKWVICLGPTQTPWSIFFTLQIISWLLCRWT